jgi:SAM-dependent methyltransferase
MAGYDTGFYDTIREGTKSSAAVVVPLMLTKMKVKAGAALNVIDVGCGEGWWAHAFAALGHEVIGMDGGYVATSPLDERFLPHDIAAPLPEHLAGRFDLALCLEVAEHLPPDRAASFVEELCALAPVVLFSAAIPGQGGTGHINEQWPWYWVELFEANKFEVSGALRWDIWNDVRVENWYRQNLLVAARDPKSLPAIFKTPLAPVWPVVHPVLYDARRR